VTSTAKRFQVGTWELKAGNNRWVMYTSFEHLLDATRCARRLYHSEGKRRGWSSVCLVDVFISPDIRFPSTMTDLEFMVPSEIDRRHYLDLNAWVEE
jgi:hypothetical protein